MTTTTNVKRIGNWYSVELDNTTYNVLIQKEPNKVTCDVSSTIVFDNDFLQVFDSEIYHKIESILDKMDWKYDMLDE